MKFVCQAQAQARPKLRPRSDRQSYGATRGPHAHTLGPEPLGWSRGLCRRKAGTRLVRGKCKHRAWDTSPRRSSCPRSSPFNVPAPRARHGRMSLAAQAAVRQRRPEAWARAAEGGRAVRQSGPAPRQRPCVARGCQGDCSLVLALHLCWTALPAVGTRCWLPAGLDIRHTDRRADGWRALRRGAAPLRVQRSLCPSQ